MKPNSKWMLTFAGVTLTAALAVLGGALVHLHPMNQVGYLTQIVSCGGGFEAHGARSEQEHVRQYSVCVDRSQADESARSASN
jgi:hypothetical protein